MSKQGALTPFFGAIAALSLAMLAGCSGPTGAPQEGTDTLQRVAQPRGWAAVLVGAGKSEDAFDNAVGRLRQALLQSGVPESNIRTLSSRRRPGAIEPTRPNMTQAFDALPRDDDIGCLLFISGHGDERGMKMEVASPYALTPRDATTLLRRHCADRAAVAIFSGCHTGVFVEGEMLASNRVIFTAARRDRSSFGCNAGAELTVFDRCLLSHLSDKNIWREVYRAVADCVARWEDLLHYEPASSPLFVAGSLVSDIAVPRFPKMSADLVEPSRAQLAARANAEIRRLRTLTVSTGPFARETDDFGVAPRREPETRRTHGPTPPTVPGAATITTRELKSRIEGNEAFRLVDVLGTVASKRAVIPGAHWVPNMGGSDWTAAAHSSGARAKAFRAILGRIAPDRDVPVAFYCVNAECWLSYNAALHALRLGYKNVYWYRGGLEAWRAAQLPLVDAAPEETPK